MSPSTPPTCTHDRGRGTTVCLRCRHEQAQVSARRRQRFFMQFLGLASVVAVLAIAGVSAASTLRNHSTSDAISEGTGAPEQRKAGGGAAENPAPKSAALVQRPAPAPQPPPRETAATPAPATAATPVAPAPTAH